MATTKSSGREREDRGDENPDRTVTMIHRNPDKHVTREPVVIPLNRWLRVARRVLAPPKATLLTKLCCDEASLLHRIDVGFAAGRGGGRCIKSNASVSFERCRAEITVFFQPDLDRESRTALLHEVLETDRHVNWRQVEEEVRNAAQQTDKITARYWEDSEYASKRLIERACCCQPTLFHTVDAHIRDPFDGYLDSEFDNRIVSTVGYELMHGAEVTILIDPKLDPVTRYELIRLVVEHEESWSNWEGVEWNFFALRCDRALGSKRARREEPGPGAINERLASVRTRDIRKTLKGIEPDDFPEMYECWRCDLFFEEWQPSSEGFAGMPEGICRPCCEELKVG